MSSVDERIVAMKFNNSQFESGVKTSLGSLESLNKGLKLEGATKGLDGVNAAAKGINLSGIASNVDKIASRFTAMGIIGVTALTNIANKAVNMGTQLLKSLSLGPIQAGYQEYETKMGSIQTILANTAKYGTTLPQVTAALDELNTYSDKTIYSFGEMVKNIGLFTNAGIRIEDATAMIKGFSNEAAASGTNAEQAAGAAYQLSQALSAGKVTLMDWRSLTNAGMGNANMKKGLIDIATAMDTFAGKGITAKDVAKDFNGSLEKGWITADVMQNYLKIQAGELSDAQMKTLGLSNEQIVAMKKQAKTAEDAATKVKTFTQLLSTVKETIGSGWSQAFEIIFGDFEEAKKLWTGVNDSISKIITKSSNARAGILNQWKALGGRNVLIETVTSAFKILGSVVSTVKGAFREIFPQKSGTELFFLTLKLQEFVKALTPTPALLNTIKRIFAGFFAVLDIGKQIIQGVFGVIGSLFKSMAGGAKGFLGLTAGVADWLVALDKALKKGDGLKKFFDSLGKVMSIPIKILSGLGVLISGIFEGFSKSKADGVSKAVGTIGTRLDKLASVGDRVYNFFNKLTMALQPFIEKISNFFSNLGNTIATALGSESFDGALALIRTGLLGGIFLMVKKFFDKGLTIDAGGGLLSSIKGAFETLTGSLKTMQQQVKAKILLEIAVALALLTASILVLSMIDGDKLAKAMFAIAVGFAELLGAMAILVKISGTAGFAKVPIVATSLLLLASAILLLTFAVKNLSSLSWGELTKGLVGVGALLLTVSMAIQPLSANAAGMVRAGVGLVAISIGLNLLYFAVKNFSSLSWTEMGKGLAGVVGSLVAIGVAMRAMPKGMLAQGAAILLLSIALNALYLAVKNFSSLSWKEMGKGLAGIAGALVAIALGMKLMPKNMVLQAFALNLVAIALMAIGKAISTMGKTETKVLVKGIIAIGAALVVLALGLHLMNGTLLGSAALVVATGALTLLVPVLAALGLMSWTQIIKGLVAIAGAFVVLGVAGLVLGPLTPTILGLSVAILAIGLGVGLAAAGLGALAAGLAALAGVGSAGIAVLVSTVAAFIQMIPEAAKQLALGLVAVIVVIGENAPAVIEAFGKILLGLLQLIIDDAPKFGEALGVLITTLLKLLVDKAPEIVQAGLTLLLDFLKGLAENIKPIVEATAKLIINFLDGLTSKDNIRKIVAGGLKVLTQMLLGISDHIADVTTAALKVVAKFIEGLGKGTKDLIKAGGKFIADMITGIGEAAGNIVAAAVWALIHFAIALSQNVIILVEAGFQIAIDFINALSDKIQKYDGPLRDAGRHLAFVIADGMSGGLLQKGVDIFNAAKNFGQNVIDGVGSAVEAKSPSRVMIRMGHDIGDGLIIGINDKQGSAVKSSENLATSTVSAMKTALSGISDILAGEVDMTPVIRPVLDLTDIQKNASQISGLIGSPKVSVASAYSNANNASASYEDSKATASKTDIKPIDKQNVTFIQNNTSPKALSAADIYRQTQNQLSVVRGALTR